MYLIFIYLIFMEKTYVLEIYVDGLHLGHVEAPTSELLLEKIGSFERWLYRTQAAGEDLKNHIITSN